MYMYMAQVGLRAQRTHVEYHTTASMMEDEPPSKRPRVSSVTLPDPPSMEKVGVESTKAVASSQAQDDEHLPTRVSDEPDIKREAYYSANFKVVLKTVLSDSPEHHVVSEYGMRMVDEFMSLSGE